MLMKQRRSALNGRVYDRHAKYSSRQRVHSSAYQTLEDIQLLATKSYDLDDTVQYWSDFNSVFYHPRSLHQVPQSEDGASELVSYDAGCESFSVFQKVTKGPETWIDGPSLTHLFD